MTQGIVYLARMGKMGIDESLVIAWIAPNLLLHCNNYACLRLSDRSRSLNCRENQLSYFDQICLRLEDVGSLVTKSPQASRDRTGDAVRTNAVIAPVSKKISIPPETRTVAPGRSNPQKSAGIAVRHAKQDLSLFVAFEQLRGTPRDKPDRTRTGAPFPACRAAARSDGIHR